jgi:hypothetical protein
MSEPLKQLDCQITGRFRNQLWSELESQCVNQIIVRLEGQIWNLLGGLFYDHLIIGLERAYK